ncbi:ion transporter [Mycolicibacterium aromaticivorans JS19b1 = JCM 16368]|uniref:Ion transporter n=1 Tax=Mycolicibacterium aromaticivorans JS19b1 = JCM 16368 TaxID=1440774 RepID=A0A064CQQ7_9MYCO|nr:ion transporter [Mycolicibacterium aromaticivorans]KDF01153.1 ion transporter [Mycolicibacterium aromaticivorans JS19b1 = JCM 16368]
MQPTTAPEPLTPKPVPTVVAVCRRLVGNPVFETLIVIVILINAAMLGAETFPTVSDGLDHAFDVGYNVILAIYVVELLIRFTAAGWSPREFVKTPWNVFDFIVIAASFIPGLRATAMLLRLVRLARIVRIVRFLPDLHIAFGAIARSIPGVASLAAATAVLIYIYGMLGWLFFGNYSPEHFGNLGRGMMTMYVMLTLENLPENVDMGLKVSPWSVLFFISYTVILSFLVFNLFIGIVLNSMEEARAADRKKHESDDLLERLRLARRALEDAEKELQRAHRDDGKPRL